MKTQKQLLAEFLDQWFAGKGIEARTSGSTGEPKPIVLSHDHVERSARRTNHFFGISKRSRLHCAISFSFIGGKMMIARSLVSGCDLTFSEPSLELTPPQPGRKVSLMSVVPAQMPYILNHPEDFADVERFLLGGSAIDSRLWKRIIESGLNVWESYGMTETASHVAIRRVAGRADCRPRFVPLPGIKISTDAENCLQIVDEDLKVETNDIARICKDGSFEILGRRDDIIISGGVKILPQEVEAILRPHIEHLCLEFIVSSVPDEVWTSRLVLIGVPVGDQDTDYISGQNLEDFSTKIRLRATIDAIPLSVLPKKMRPKDIILMPSLPLTPSGKLLRHLQ